MKARLLYTAVVKWRRIEEKSTRLLLEDQFSTGSASMANRTVQNHAKFCLGNLVENSTSLCDGENQLHS